MVLRIRHIQISRRIERHAPRIAESSWLGSRAADDFERLIIGVKNLDAAVAEFADVLPPGGIHANVVRIAQLAFARAGFAVGAYEGSVARKDLDAVIAGVGDVKPVLGIHAQAFGTVARAAETAEKPCCRNAGALVWGPTNRRDGGRIGARKS